MEFSPVIIFAYNRPHYLKETLSALKNNVEASDTDLYIFCDGPKINAEEKTLKLIQEVRELVKSEQWCKNVFIKESESNKGLSKSIVSGVTEVVNQYGKVIVLEDDIVPAPFFLKFMNDALEMYKDENSVNSVSGYNFPIPNVSELNETFFLRAVSSWSWGTWDRSWKLYDHDASELLEKLKRSGKEKEFDFNNTYPYLKMLKNTINGKVNSWAIRWYASCFLNNSLTIFPFKPLVKNIGFTGTNINSDNRKYIGEEVYNGKIKYFEIKIEESIQARLGWQKHLDKYNRRKISYENVKYAFSKLKNILKLK